MNLIVDANILFAALIKEGKTVEILLNPFLNFYSPEFILEEFEKYESTILDKTHRNFMDFSEILQNLKELINVIPREDYQDKIEVAKKVSPDENDFPYFALALKLGCAIWSNDKNLKKQERVRIYSTVELVEILSK